jgi:myo-inositol-1(or 4)-monophosphatase
MKQATKKYLNFAESIAREAGLLLKRRFGESHQIEFKGRINIVTEADRLSEELLIRKIMHSFPGHDILTEESAGIQHGSDFRWILDPLDGTTNYAHGFPVFCISLALEIESAVSLGVIYNPMLDEMFTASKGEGAFLNGRAVQVSETLELSRSLLATGFPYDIREARDNNISYFIGMIMKAQAVRRAGSAALDLAYVAAGRFDGFWELKLMPWDTAAGWLMVREAGGVVTDLAGSTYGLDSPHVLASNGKIHRAMREVLDTCNRSA